MQVRTASCAGTACVNSFGDEQLAVDMVADKLLFDALRFSVRAHCDTADTLKQRHDLRATSACNCLQHVCSFACSEEVPEPVNMGGSGFSVAFDPLDGSSIVDTNFAVGTIFGVWPGDKLVGVTGRDQVRQQRMAAPTSPCPSISPRLQAAAGMGVFGPRTVYVVAIKGFPGTFEFLLQDDGKW